MSIPDDIDPIEDPFAALIESVDSVFDGRTVIGSQEAELRQRLGDAKYEEIVAYNDDMADAQLESVQVSTDLTRAFIDRNKATADFIKAGVAILKTVNKLLGTYLPGKSDPK
jgi:hypothetical protein